jgi:arylsulfatase A-like enzyme
MDWDVPDEAIIKSRPKYEIGARGPSVYRAHTDNEFRRMRCTYYGLVSHIDQQIGRLIDFLRETEQLKNTIILYTADHGDLIGEYGQFGKGMFYDISTRVPCIIAGPGVPEGKRTSCLTECVDVATTLLDVADIPIPDSMVGRNMFTGHERNNVIGEIALRRGGVLQRRSWIRTHTWSMDFTSEVDRVPTTSPEDKDGKLVNLEIDPLEHINLYNDPQYSSILEELENQFIVRTSNQRVPMQNGRNPFPQGV